VKKSIVLFILFMSCMAFPRTKEDSLQVELEHSELKQEMKEYTDNKVNDASAKLQEDIKKTNFLNYAGFGVLVLIVGGSLLAMWKKAKNQMSKQIEARIYAVDPLHVQLRVPDESFAVEHDRLKWLGFKNIKTYTELDRNCLAGCVVAKVTNDEKLEQLHNFLKDYKDKIKRTAFVIYTPGYRIPGDSTLIDEFPNTIMANMPITIGQAIFTVARAVKA